MFFANRRLRRDGQQATATVLSCEYRSKWTSNELRDFDYVLRVQPAVGEAFDAEVRDKFWIVGLRPKEGDEDVPVCFDPTSHKTAPAVGRPARPAHPYLGFDPGALGTSKMSPNR
jgi:hypothetical protein